MSFATVPRGILLVTVVAVAAIGTCPDVMPERPPPPKQADVAGTEAVTVCVPLPALPAKTAVPSGVSATSNALPESPAEST
jgi:hypothetical protein